MRKRILILAIVGATIASLFRQALAQSYAWERVSSNLVYTAGKVGVGTRYPIKKLHVEGDMWVGRTGGSNLAINTPLGSVRFNSQGDDIIFPEGNVGIGTLNPTKKLTVDGTVRAKEIIVDSGWADHVFDPEYKLASIETVASYIKTHRRLPGIVSAQEVASEGVEVSQALTSILTKVEELSLYLININDRVKALESKPMGGSDEYGEYLESLAFIEVEGRKLYLSEPAKSIDQRLANAISNKLPEGKAVVTDLELSAGWAIVSVKSGERLLSLIAQESGSDWQVEELNTVKADQLVCAAPESLLSMEAKKSFMSDSDECPALEFNQKYILNFGVFGESLSSESKQSVYDSLNKLGKPSSKEFNYRLENPIVFQSPSKLATFVLVNLHNPSQTYQAIIFKTKQGWHTNLYKRQTAKAILELITHNFRNLLSL